MSSHNDYSQEPQDDSALEEMLSPLKRLEPPLEARVANRQAVSAALSALSAVNHRLPWWRRSISIPVPLAAALAVLMAVALFSSLRDWQKGAAVPVARTGQPAKEAAVKLTAGVSPPWKYYETETYLCGVGRVSSKFDYLIQE